MVCHDIIGPRRTVVPSPAPAVLLVIFATRTLIGPRIALERMEGSQIIGCCRILGNWSLEVPSPTARSPKIPLSLYPARANPIILQQQPMVAAPAAKPDNCSITARAGALRGKVQVIPIRTARVIPIRNGCCCVPQEINSPNFSMT